jgi:hypothetical protein
MHSISLCGYKGKTNIKILKVDRYMCERRKVKRKKIVKDGGK